MFQNLTDRLKGITTQPKAVLFSSQGAFSFSLTTEWSSQYCHWELSSVLSSFFLTAVDNYSDQKCATLSHQMSITVGITFIRNMKCLSLLKCPTKLLQLCYYCTLNPSFPSTTGFQMWNNILNPLVFKLLWFFSSPITFKILMLRLKKGSKCFLKQRHSHNKHAVDSLPQTQK